MTDAACPWSAYQAEGDALAADAALHTPNRSFPPIRKSLAACSGEDGSTSGRRWQQLQGAHAACVDRLHLSSYAGSRNLHREEDHASVNTTGPDKMVAACLQWRRRQRSRLPAEVVQLWLSGCRGRDASRTPSPLQLQQG